MINMLKAGLFSLLLWMPALQAADSGWLRSAYNDHTQVRLRLNDKPDVPAQLLLDVQLTTGWKTYWRSPGEGGVAPVIHWDNPVKDVTIAWPAPQRFSIAGMITQGYHGKVSLPITLTPGDDRPLRGTLTLPTCSNVCVLTDYPLPWRAMRHRVLILLLIMVGRWAQFLLPMRCPHNWKLTGKQAS